MYHTRKYPRFALLPILILASWFAAGPGALSAWAGPPPPGSCNSSGCNAGGQTGGVIIINSGVTTIILHGPSSGRVTGGPYGGPSSGPPVVTPADYCYPPLYNGISNSGYPGGVPVDPGGNPVNMATVLAGGWTCSGGRPCGIPTNDPATGTMVTIPCPTGPPPQAQPVIYTPPTAQEIALDISQNWKAGGIETSPRNDFYVFLATCAGAPNSNIPTDSQTVVANPSGVGYSAKITIKVAPQHSPNSVKWTWGDGTTSWGTYSPGQHFNQSECAVENQHLYKTVGSGIRIRADETITFTVTTQWTDGRGPQPPVTSSITLPTYTVFSGPHNIFQLEPVPYSNNSN